MENMSDDLKKDLKKKKQKVDDLRAEIRYLEQKIEFDKHYLAHDDAWHYGVQAPTELVLSGLYIVMLALVGLIAGIFIACGPLPVTIVGIGILVPMIYPPLTIPFYFSKLAKLDKCKDRLKAARNELRWAEIEAEYTGYDVDLLKYEDLETKEEQVVQPAIVEKESKNIFTKLLNKFKKKSKDQNKQVEVQEKPVVTESTNKEENNEYEPDNANDTINL